MRLTLQRPPLRHCSCRRRPLTSPPCPSSAAAGAPGPPAPGPSTGRPPCPAPCRKAVNVMSQSRSQASAAGAPAPPAPVPRQVAHRVLLSARLSHHIWKCARQCLAATCRHIAKVRHCPQRWCTLVLAIIRDTNCLLPSIRMSIAIMVHTGEFWCSPQAHLDRSASAALTTRSGRPTGARQGRCGRKGFRACDWPPSRSGVLPDTTAAIGAICEATATTITIIMNSSRAM